MPPELGRRLVADLDRAPAVRVEVGPMPWFVLEAMAAECPPGQVAAEVEINSRDLARSLGLSKDTVGRAIRVLAAAGLVRRADRRDQRSGRFGASVYAIDLAVAGLEVIDSADRPAIDRVDGGRCRPPTIAVPPWTQLDLLSWAPTSRPRHARRRRQPTRCSRATPALGRCTTRNP